MSSNKNRTGNNKVQASMSWNEKSITARDDKNEEHVDYSRVNRNSEKNNKN